MKSVLVLLFLGFVVIANAHDTSEERCAIACTANYSPICAENGKRERKTFGNDCEIQQYNCNSEFKAIFNGDCANENNKCSTIPCPSIYNPICAVNPNGDRKFFSNECVLKQHNCKSEFKVLNDGYC